MGHTKGAIGHFIHRGLSFPIPVQVSGMLRCCLAVFIRIEARFDEGSNIPDILHKEGLSEKVKISPECPIRFLNSYQSYM